MVAYEHDIDRISGEILRYLHSHRNAADTLEGITKWWLTRQRYEEATVTVKKALEKLIAYGLVAQSNNADDQCIYSKQKAKPCQRGRNNDEDNKPQRIIFKNKEDLSCQ